jgi:hypothetical protein
MVSLGSEQAKGLNFQRIIQEMMGKKGLKEAVRQLGHFDIFLKTKLP